MSLLFNTLSRFVIAFLPRSKLLLISWLQSPSTVILEPKKRKAIITSTRMENPHGSRSLEGYSPWGHKGSDPTEQLSTHTAHLQFTIVFVFMVCWWGCCSTVHCSVSCSLLFEGSGWSVVPKVRGNQKPRTSLTLSLTLDLGKMTLQPALSKHWMCESELMQGFSVTRVIWDACYTMWIPHLSYKRVWGTQSCNKCCRWRDPQALV